VNLSQYFSFILCGLFLLPSTTVQASDQGLMTSLLGRYKVEAKPLDTVLKTTDRDQLSKAQFNSGLGLMFSNTLFDVNLDYVLKGNMKRAEEVDAGSLSQALSASMRSSMLNDIFAIDASIDADSAVAADGDAYHYKITPGFSRSLFNLADLDVKYNYQLSKLDAGVMAQETKGYSLGLNGAMRKGRLLWKGLYSESDLYKDQVLSNENTELFDFNSSYRLVKDLLVEFRSAIKNQTLFNGAVDQQYSEKRFGAGISWSPSERYELSLHVNHVDQSRYQRDDVFGTGLFTWSPKHDLELSLGYGDDLLDGGGRGFLFSTKLDLDKS
jgi:hypothetical protein